MTQDKRNSDVYAMLHWVKRGQCDTQILSLARVRYFASWQRISGKMCEIANRFALLFVDMVTISW